MGSCYGQKYLQNEIILAFGLVSMLNCVFNYLHEHIFAVVSVSYSVTYCNGVDFHLL